MSNLKYQEIVNHLLVQVILVLQVHCHLMFDHCLVIILLFPMVNDA